jgi:hypothetical protein
VFGVARLSVSNVFGSVSLTPIAPFLSSASLGGTIVLGQISFEGRVGINWANPTMD